MLDPEHRRLERFRHLSGLIVAETSAGQWGSLPAQ